MSESLRIIFAGTPDFAARHLDALLSSGHNVVGVFTQPDRPAGRGKKLMPSPVKVLAEEKGLPVFQPVSLRPQENQQLVADLQADVMAPGYLPLHILIRRMSQYHRFGGRYAPMYLQQLLSGNEEHVHHRDIRGKLRKERLISGQTMLGDAYQNTFIF